MEERFYDDATSKKLHVTEMRKIIFKCIDSQFFTNFDGEWRVEELPSKNSATGVETKLSYLVDVRPKGVVPVVALEWRIREDVPTNLRSVKLASETVGHEGVKKLRGGRGSDNQSGPRPPAALKPSQSSGSAPTSSSTTSTSTSSSSTASIVPKPPASPPPPKGGRKRNSRLSALRPKSRVRDFVGRFNTPRQIQASYAMQKVDWGSDETMAAYQKKQEDR